VTADDIRAFVAVEVPADLRELIWSAFSAEHAGYPGLRWVPPENLHLTVKFLGGVPRPRVPELIRAVERACSEHTPFSVSLRGAGVFPPRGLPRVLWVGAADGTAQLAALAGTVDRYLGKRGIERERRPFSAHLTLARCRRDGVLLDAGPLVSRFQECEWGNFEVQALSFMQSHLGPAGARYERLAAIPLAGVEG